MSYEQLPMLFLRGSLLKQTAKNLSKEQLNQVEEIMDEIWNDPDLQGHKYAFCEALRSTIKGEYLDREKAEQEARIAIWKACVSVLFHDKKISDEDRTKIVSNNIQRGKYFKTWLFNYLRQILRENKIPAIKSYPTETGPASYIAAMAFKSLIEYKKLPVELYETEDGYVLDNINQNAWPLFLSLDISSLIEEYKQFGLIIEINKTKITIKRSVVLVEEPTIECKLIKSIRVKESSLNHDSDDDNGLQFALEYQLLDGKPTENSIIADTDEIKVLKDKIPDNIKPILELIINTPTEFIEVYGDRIPAKNQIAKFLNKSAKEVDEAFKILRLHTIAIGMKS